jgi:hypothetical protein
VIFLKEKVDIPNNLSDLDNFSYPLGVLGLWKILSKILTTSLDMLFPLSMFVVDNSKPMLKEVEATPKTPTLFSILNFELPSLNEKEKDNENSSAFSGSNSNSFPHHLWNGNILRGEVNIFEGFPKMSAFDLPNRKYKLPTPAFFSNLLNKLFRIFFFPYICKLNYELEDGYADVVIFKKRSDGDEEDLDDTDILLIVEMKGDDVEEGKDGVDQLLSYSRDLLENYKGRFLVLSMLCDMEWFSFYCAIRINRDVVLIQLGEPDHFSFMLKTEGLLKVLYVLSLPWPVYGSMIIKDAKDSFQILKQEKYLGSGSSAEVYQYKLDNQPPVAVKFFKSCCKDQFSKEVLIYSLLKEKNASVSLEMLWSNEERLTICTDGVRNPISLRHLPSESIAELFDSLHTFHGVTEHVHRDIYFMNILESSNGKLYLNDFGLAVPVNSPQPIKGNLYFASNDVLLSKDSSNFRYSFSDDLFSLTFSLIFLHFSNFFTSGFEELKDLENVDRQSILSKRIEIINRMSLSFKEIVFEALGAAAKTNYDDAKKHTLKLIFPYE